MIETIPIAQKIKKLRAKRNITHYDLAKAIGVSRTCISNWEKGIRIPESENILKMSEYFSVTVDYLCGRCSDTNTVIAPPTFEMDITKLNMAGQDALLTYYNFLLTDEKYVTDI